MSHHHQLQVTITKNCYQQIKKAAVIAEEVTRVVMSYSAIIIHHVMLINLYMYFHTTCKTILCRFSTLPITIVSLVM